MKIKRPKKLAVQIHGTHLSMLLFDRRGPLKYESLLLQESLEESPGAKVRKFLENQRTEETLLILGRFEIMQKELALTEGENFRENLEAKLTQILPYSPREMAYGLAAFTPEEISKVLLYAVPEKRVREALELFTRLGIQVDEIVSEDQCLWWLVGRKISREPVLVIDANEERFLFSLVLSQGIIFSRQYERTGENLEEIISEVSRTLLESGFAISKIIFLKISEGEKEEISRTFKVGVENFSPNIPFNLEIPAGMMGALSWGQYPVVSLLPQDLKIRKREISKRKLLKDALVTFGLFMASFSLWMTLHGIFLKQKASFLRKQAASLSAQVGEIKKMATALDQMQNSAYSKERLANFIKELAEQVPVSIRLKSLEAGEGEMVLDAEASSHSLISETVQAFEKNEFLRDVKLEHTRLRKRMNQDFFEFEITAKWKV